MNGIPEKKNLYGEGRYHKMIEASADSVDADHNWLITLSDMLSLLLVFFIIFFAMSRVPGKKKEIPIPINSSPVISSPVPNSQTNNTIKTIQKEMGATVLGLGLDDQVMIQAGEQEILIIIKENVTFHTGEAAIIEGSQPILDTVAGIIKKYPSFQVEIEGHTDDLPINTTQYPSNWELSVARATSVLKYLIAGHGLDPARFTIKGNAEQRPLFPNMTPEQRAQNRRVEIRLRDPHAT